MELLLLGMEGLDFVPMSRLVGELDDWYEELRANQKIYYLVPKLLKGTCKCVVFSPLEKAPPDTDVLIITANTTQAEILLRACTYSTGRMWNVKGSTCLACAWSLSPSPRTCYP